MVESKEEALMKEWRRPDAILVAVLRQSSFGDGQQPLWLGVSLFFAASSLRKPWGWYLYSVFRSSPSI
jgi:hypothetical protein